MSGILSSLGVLLRFAGNVSEKGVAKGTLETLEDNKIKLLNADGSMMHLMGQYVVEPIAVVSSDLKSVEELDKILGLHMDLFVSNYMQVFEILRDHYQLSLNTAVDTLATDNGGLMRVVVKGLDEGIKLSNEDFDFVGELLDTANALIGDGEAVSTEDSALDDPLTDPVVLAATRTSDTYKKARAAELATMTSEIDFGKRRKMMRDQEEIKRIDTERLGNKYRQELARKLKPGERATAANRDRKSYRPELASNTKDLLIPNAIQRTIEITTEYPMAEPGTDGKIYTKTVTFPVVVKLAVIFTSADNILNAIETSGDEYSFSSRLDEYRAGAQSMVEFLFASDLVDRYKARKLKDKDALLAIMKARELSANSKMVTNGFAGFEKYYNMYIVSPEAKVAIERSIRAPLSKAKGRATFLERANGLSVTIVDPDAERVRIMFKDTRGTSDLSFRNAIKKDKSGADYSEIIKALVANKAPTF